MICPLCDAEVAPGGFVTATPSRPIDGKSYACEACHAAWRALLVDVLDTVGACGSAFASTIIAAGRAYLAREPGTDRHAYALPTRVPDQPPPTPQPARRAAWSLVIGYATRYLANDDPSTVQPVLDDMRERHRVGVERYGKPLTGGNGRDCLVDAYQELLDHAAYLGARLDELGAFNADGNLAARFTNGGALVTVLGAAPERHEARALVPMLDAAITSLVELKDLMSRKEGR